LLTEVVGVFADDGLVVNAELDPADQTFLDDHRIDDTPFLPGVMGMELFAQVASLPFADRHVTAIEDVDFLAPFKFYRDEPRALRLSAQYSIDGDDVVADCRLIGERMLATQDEPQRTVHFVGRVRLGTEPPALDDVAVPDRTGVAATPDDIYAIYFHGPAYQVMGDAWASNGSVVGARATELPANQQPADTGLFTRDMLHGEIHELVRGNVAGRESHSERNLIHTTGLVAHDIAMCHYVYEKALEKGIGVRLPFTGTGNPGPVD